MNAGLIFPHQLFEEHPVLDHTDKVFLIEDSLFFGDKHHPLRFHKQKLIFHRATMKEYQNYLNKKDVDVTYIEYDPDKTITDIIEDINPDKLVYCDTVDYLLDKRIKRTQIEAQVVPTPLFLNTQQENDEYLESHSSNLMHHFYVWQRKRLEIMVDDNKKPDGGSWSFDEDNRKKLPKKLFEETPTIPLMNDSGAIKQAKKYIETIAEHNPGHTDHFIYPINHTQAKTWFQDFLKKRFHNFGPYEDAITNQHTMLYHSLLSPLINVGLLTPEYVVHHTLEYARKHDIPTQSLEGFIRQIIGWREYMRMMYRKHGVAMRTSNEWNHVNDLPQSFYTAKTGIEPLDTSIKRTLDYAYCHHIERLMVLGNAMFLLQIEPKQIYTWFMEMFIDAYDWVMVPNVYAMSQNTSKGLITTKPYISGSNYIRKMSNYNKGSWSDAWDAWFWSWCIDHHPELEENGRMHFVAARAKKYGQDNEKKKQYEATKQKSWKTMQ